MAKERTEDSRYKSRYGGGFITDAQYLTECLCFLIARQQREDLCDNFWKNEPWKTVFRKQIPGAEKLLKEYPAEVILMMMRDSRCHKIKSFHARSLFNHILVQKMREYELKNKQEEHVVQEKPDVMQKPPKRGNSSSILSKLKGL